MTLCPLRDLLASNLRVTQVPGTVIFFCSRHMSRIPDGPASSSAAAEAGEAGADLLHRVHAPYTDGIDQGVVARRSGAFMPDLR